MLWEFLKSKMQKNPNKRVCENSAEITFEELIVFAENFSERLKVRIRNGGGYGFACLLCGRYYGSAALPQIRRAALQ